MAIDMSGKCWTSDNPADIEGYLKLLKPEGYAIDLYRHCLCACGSIEFRLFAGKDEGVGQRECIKCRETFFICDGEEYAEDAELIEFPCPCGGLTKNVGVGFSMNDSEPETVIRWISVGTRCVACGILASPLDWKIQYGPSVHLIDMV
jgi:hypothetical protein